MGKDETASKRSAHPKAPERPPETKVRLLPSWAVFDTVEEAKPKPQPIHRSARLPAGEVGTGATPIFDALVRLPTGGIDENRAIDCLAAFISKMLHKLKPKFSQEWLKTELTKGLREGREPLCSYAVEAAEKNEDEIADDALRTVFGEWVGGALPERGPGHLQVWAYGQRAVKRAPHKRARGRSWHDNWTRNFEICALIWYTYRALGISPTRNRATKDIPSAISLIVVALARNGLCYTEEHVQDRLWCGLVGELVQSCLEDYACE
jgi:hypothetical protein